jgi:F-type H+-transporting ATPase subunit gamma
VGSVLTGLAQTLAGLNAPGGRLEVLCHEPQQYRVRRVAVLPPPTGGTSAAAPPRLQQYLFAVFNGLLIGSLLVENQQRIAHLQAALQRLDDRCEELRQRQRHARQEQIIEEGEVALSVAGTEP